MIKKTIELGPNPKEPKEVKEMKKRANPCTWMMMKKRHRRQSALAQVKRTQKVEVHKKTRQTAKSQKQKTYTYGLEAAQ